MKKRQQSEPPLVITHLTVSREAAERLGELAKSTGRDLDELISQYLAGELVLPTSAQPCAMDRADQPPVPDRATMRLS
jgi:hypothetical protein